MRFFHFASLTAIVMAAGLALGLSQASADSPTATALMNATYPTQDFGNIKLTNGAYSSVGDPNAISRGGPYSMSYLTSTPGTWDGHDVSAVVTQITQNGTTMSQVWLVDSTLKPFGGALIEGNVQAVVPTFTNGQLGINAAIRNADGSISQWNGVYDIVVGELKLVAPVAQASAAPSTPTSPSASGTSGTGTGAGTTTGAGQTTQVTPAAAGNGGLLPEGTTNGVGLALAGILALSLVGIRRLTTGV